jgi:hypothetical protein
VAYYIAPISNGLGDLIVSIPILQALISTGEPTHLIMRSPAQYGLADCIEGLAGSLKESEFNPSSLAKTDKFFNFRNHPLQSDYLWGSKEFEAQYPGYRINDVLKGICRDWGIQADFESLKPLSFRRKHDCADRILLVPGSAGLFKCWPAAHWIELADGLQKRGRQVAVIGQPERSDVVREVLDFGIDHIATPTLKDALDVVSSAAGAVSVDTGLMHLCVHQGIPTVALFRYNTMFLRPYSRTRNLIGPLCPKECMDREFEGAPNERIEYKVWQLWEPMTCALDDPNEHCMAKIQPAQVLESIMELAVEKSRLD